MKKILMLSIMLLLTACSKETVAEPIIDPKEELIVEEEQKVVEEPITEENDTAVDSTSLTKDEYFVLLNEMNDEDHNGEVVDDSTQGLIKEETLRYEKWDKMLNEIYTDLKEQLSESDMSLLRDEQRQWVIDRDKIAKEASDKYAGGTMENLEYVATQASLTRERCFELVAKYMK